MARPGNKHRQQNTLRIIGGRWRGRRLSFKPVAGLRPTPDRVRETLFNWLATSVHGARCLDLFAGSGALGLEALSRGALHCDFVDSSQAAIQQIEQHLDLLQTRDAARCHRLDAGAFLDSAAQPYDIVFLDPPFKRNLIGPTCSSLLNRQLIASAGLIYVETSAGEPCPDVPDVWVLHRDKIAGDVAYRLFKEPGAIQPN